MSRRLRPLSMTCVRPVWRGLGARAGRSRNPSESSNDLLQSLRGFGLNVAVHRVAVRVDADPERAEVLDAELPEALGHELLPVDLLDLLDLGRLEGCGAADEREVDHAVLLHRLDRLVWEPAFPGDGADAVVAPERLGEAHHAGARRRAHAHRLVLARAELADVRRGVEQEGAFEVERRVDALVEDPDLRAVADPEDVAVDGDQVARVELTDVLLAGRKCQPVLSHRPSGPALGSDPVCSLLAGVWGQTPKKMCDGSGAILRTPGRNRRGRPG